MRYWEDFQNKWGFGDGDNVPPDARALRHVYVREINRLAARLGSKVKLIAFDRTGFHNSLLICRIAARRVRNVPELGLCAGAGGGGYVPNGGDLGCEDDEAMTNAIDHFLCGDNEDLDQLVEVDVRIRELPTTVIRLSARKEGR